MIQCASDICILYDFTKKQYQVQVFRKTSMIILLALLENVFEDTEVVIKIRKSMERHCNRQKEKQNRTTNNGRQKPTKTVNIGQYDPH